VGSVYFIPGWDSGDRDIGAWHFEEGDEHEFLHKDVPQEPGRADRGQHWDPSSVLEVGRPEAWLGHGQSRSIQPQKKVDAQAYILSHEEGDHPKFFVSHIMSILSSLSWNVACWVILQQYMILEKGQLFNVQDSDKITGTVPIPDTPAMTQESKKVEPGLLLRLFEIRAALASVPFLFWCPVAQVDNQRAAS
jgi:hypothetical protein